MEHQLLIDPLRHQFLQLRQILLNRRHRLPIVCYEAEKGTNVFASQSYRLFETLLQPENFASSLVVTEHQSETIETIAPAKYQKLLGREWDLIIIDALEGLRANVVAAASGAVKAGGFLVLIAPQKSSWSLQQDAETQRLFGEVRPQKSWFIERFIAQADVHAVAVDWSRSTSFIPELKPVSPAASDCDPFDEQTALIPQIKRVFTGHPKRPLVIQADRGRGKSSALGKAIAELVNETQKKIVVTAAHRRSVDRVIEWFSDGVFDEFSEHLCFMAPDELLEKLINTNFDCDGIVVDEAAAIPAPVLELIAKQHNRLVFSTTVQGYEGSGRGFNIRFKNKLAEMMPQWKQRYLHRPIRWHENDPLEDFTDKALMLTHRLISDTAQTTIAFDWIQPGEAFDEGLLEQSFGLLVDSHYQTTPDDFRQFLDHPRRTVLIARKGESVLAVCVLLAEGQIDSTLAAQIAVGERRLRGHLSAQSLAYHFANSALASNSYWRIQRIAVAPESRRKKLGLQLLQQVEQRAMQLRVDYLSTSFAASLDLIDFWSAAEFQPVRLGLTRDKSSGCHSLMMLKSLHSDRLSKLVAHCHRSLRLLASACYQTVDPMILQRLMTLSSETESSPRLDFVGIEQFVRGERGFFDTAVEVDILIEESCHCDLKDAALRRAHAALIAALWQGLSSKQWCRLFNASGKKQQEEMLRDACANLIAKVTKVKGKIVNERNC